MTQVCRLAVGLVLTAALLTISATPSAAATPMPDRAVVACALVGAGAIIFYVSDKETAGGGALICGGLLLAYAAVGALAHKGARTALAPNTQKEAVPGLILRVSPRDGETSVGWQWRF